MAVIRDSLHFCTITIYFPSLALVHYLYRNNILSINSHESVTVVRTWLVGAGIEEKRIKLSKSRNWLLFDATVAEAEKLLKAEYFNFEHKQNGQGHVACDAYHVPEHVAKHVDIILPTVHFDVKPMKRSEASKRSAQGGISGGVEDIEARTIIQVPDDNSTETGMDNCKTHITPDCLRSMYNIPQLSKASSMNSHGVVEYTPSAYIASDLDLFFGNFSPSLVGKRPTLASIDGGVVQTSQRGWDVNAEANMALQFSMSLISPQKVTLYQVGDTINSGSFNTFLGKRYMTNKVDLISISNLV
jgi:tripeptidyl-peptidase I